MSLRKSEPAKAATREQCAIALAMNALSHPRRVAIYEILERSAPRSVTLKALMAEMKLPVSTLNHHLEPMQEAGLVRRRLRGAAAYFTLRPESVAPTMARLQQGLALVSGSGARRTPDEPPQVATATGQVSRAGQTTGVQIAASA